MRHDRGSCIGALPFGDREAHWRRHTPADENACRVCWGGFPVYGRRTESKYHRLEKGGAVREVAEGESCEKKQMHIEDQDTWVVVENTHPALISREPVVRRFRIPE